jgi:hypothetical protein
MGESRKGKEMVKERITICLRYVAASLLKRVGISGLIGAGIGLAYTPYSIVAIRMAYAYDPNIPTLVEIMTFPAVPFFFFAASIDPVDVFEWPGWLIPVGFFTAVGAGIGASVHWTRNLVKKTGSK